MGKIKLSANEKKLMTRLRQKGRQTVDLGVDHPWLSEITSRPSDLLHQLHLKGLAHPLQRGRHQVELDRIPSRHPRVESFEVLVATVLARTEKPYYLSWHSALWHHGLVDQQSTIAYVAVKEQKWPMAELGRLKVEFICLNDQHFFGYATSRRGGWPVRVASVEKAIVDSFFRPELALGMTQVAMALERAWRNGQLEPEKLSATAIQFGNKALCRRLGYVMEGLGIPGWEALIGHLGWSGPTALEAGGERAKEGSVSQRWRVWEDEGLLAVAASPK